MPPLFIIYNITKRITDLKSMEETIFCFPRSTRIIDFDMTYGFI